MLLSFVFLQAALGHGLSVDNARLVAGVLALGPWDPAARRVG